MAGKRCLRLSLVLLCLLMLIGFGVYSLMIYGVSAAESLQKEGLAVLDKVLCLDMAGYAVTAEAHADAQALYLGVAPQVNVEYTLAAEKSCLRVLCTFTDGKLQFLHVLDCEGEPLTDKEAYAGADVADKAAAFLDNYKAYTGEALYGEFSAMLRDVALDGNVTRVSGSRRLDVSAAGSYVTFKWTYVSDGVLAPSKFVAMGFKDGRLTAFVDNWQIHAVGSTSIGVSEKEASEIALSVARDHSWSLPVDAETLENLRVSWAELIFDHSVGADCARGEDVLAVYPVWRVGVSLDKWYGYMYGIEVDVWADSGLVRRVREAWSTLPPPEGVAAADLSGFVVSGVSLSEAAAYDGLLAQSFGVYDAGSEGAASFWVAFSVLCAVGFVAVPVLVDGGKARRGVKVAVVVLCFVMLLVVFFQSVPVSASSSRAAVVWGSESTGAYNSSLGFSWRKHPYEVMYQRYISGNIANYFGSNGYSAFNMQGNPGSVKSNVLSTLQSLTSNYDNVAVIVFDHGVGSVSYSQAPNEWHYLFEDNVGTVIGSAWPGASQPDNGVYDMDIYPLTETRKVFFAFINTCLSANTSDWQVINGTWWYSAQGMGVYGARGLPFAFTHRYVKWRYAPGFNEAIHISNSSYENPDNGPHVFIGFPWGSPSLILRIPYNTGIEYMQWVNTFFYYALFYSMSVNQALDHAAYQHWGCYFGNCPLWTGFQTVWPIYKNGTWNQNPYGPCYMYCYGNGNVCLK